MSVGFSAELSLYTSGVSYAVAPVFAAGTRRTATSYGLGGTAQPALGSGPSCGCETLSKSYYLCNSEKGSTCVAGVQARFTECMSGEGIGATACELECNNACSTCLSEYFCQGPCCGTECCTASQTCINGACRSVACGNGLSRCGGACVNLSNDPSNCGSCNDACPASSPICTNGVCRSVVCSAPYVNCGGTCVDPQTDSSNCGRCGVSCGSGFCVHGACSSCPPSATDCGACSGIELGTWEIACNRGYLVCLMDCGEPGTPNPQDCKARCLTAKTTCLASCPTCRYLSSDVNNCGSCHYVCPTPSSSYSFCASGGCGFVCYSPFPNQCNGGCVNFQNDPNNCGGCGITCPSGQTCCNGNCCPQNQCCGNACVDTDTDDNNCGSCGFPCGPGSNCVSGTCQCTTPGTTQQCTANGCCGGGQVQTCTGSHQWTACACPVGLTSCGGTCVDTSTDNSNCGSCGNACDTSGINVPSPQYCAGGTCVSESGSGGQNTGSIIVYVGFGAVSDPSYFCTGSGTVTISLGSGSSQSKNYSYSGPSSDQPPACSAPPLTFSNLRPGNWTVKAPPATCTAQVTAGQTTIVQIIDNVCQ